MADYSGVVADDVLVDRTYAMAAPQFSYTGNFASLQALTVPAPAGTWAAGGVVHSVTAGGTNYDGYVLRESTPGYDWFNRLHLIPRQIFDFGTIVSQVTDTFEIFNAWGTDIAFTDYINPVGASVTIPDLPAFPGTIRAFTSFVDSSSTGTVVIGNPSYLPIELVIAKDGPPIMDGALEFYFGTGQVLTLELRGTRVSLILPVYEEPFEEHWTFHSDGIMSDDGHEQVIALNANPVQTLVVNYLLDSTSRQRMQHILHGAMAQMLAMPVWHEQTRTTTTLSALATSASVHSTTDRDYRVGGYALIWESDTKYDIVKLSSVSATSLGFTTTPLINAYTSTGIKVAPVRLGHIIAEPNGPRLIRDLETFRIAFQVRDNDTGAPSASTTGWSTYGGKVLLDDPNLVQESMEFGIIQQIYVIDNAVGVIELGSDMTHALRRATKGFLMNSQAQIMKVRKLLLSLRGPQVSWRIPTFIDDLTVAADLVSGASTMDITHVGYTKFSEATEPKKHFRITFTDGTTLEREILSSVEVSTSVERLTLNTTWPGNRPVAQIERVSFLELTRFATSRFVFRYERPGLARLTAPTKTLVE